MKEVSDRLKCSIGKVNYWMKKHDIQKRSRSNAAYVKHNPKGDPFKFNKPKTLEESFLFGLGLGLYWGEGTKSNKQSIRLGNTDPYLIKYFIKFLKNIYQIQDKKLTFGLQIFSDMDKDKALNFWINQLGVDEDKFQKVIVTKSGKKGTYNRKIKHGVLTVYCSNVKLRSIIGKEIDKLRDKK